MTPNGDLLPRNTRVWLCKSNGNPSDHAGTGRGSESAGVVSHLPEFNNPGSYDPAHSLCAGGSVGGALGARWRDVKFALDLRKTYKDPNIKLLKRIKIQRGFRPVGVKWHV